ncbi:alpha/beta hydrolase [Ktedonosporobacter rubrisoli]|uniref:Alpha/beta hydrolase n=1 Tax=Ktedonosporobacter rubrisoli TaxID=2509675 RepID=A0A4P6JII3_KTERU|nr:alpha/beta hydrolase [Ktedonosporobacter rubrisoli]QBD74722.1 alpha/beta hydrolase [Ktedonosporobacter rubrisoli]
MPIQAVHDEFAIAGDTTLHWVQWGTQGPPVVCIHGLTANAFCFQAFADELARDHRVIAYDLRGRGDSDKPEEDYSVPIHAQDLAELIDELALERPIIIGHSLGAFIALYFAAHYPSKLSRLVLVDGGAPLPWSTPAEQPAWLTAAVNRLGQPVPSFQQYLNALQAAPFLKPYWNEYFDIYFEHDVLQESDGSVIAKAYRNGILEEGLRMPEAAPQEQWAQVQVPTLLLRAGQGLFLADDQLLSERAAEAMQQSIKQCTYLNFPSLNHYTIIFGVDPKPAQEIQRFLSEGSG